MNNAGSQTIWGSLVGILLFAVVGMALAWLFFWGMNTDLSAYGLSSIPTKATTITNLNTQIQELEQQLEEVQKSEEAVKYAIAQHVEQNIQHKVWSSNINSLVEMYIQLRSIGMTTSDMVELSNFVVEQERIGLRGRVSSLNTIYKEDGVIDRLKRLEFISNIQIPSYQKVDNVFEFQIQGEVNAS